MGAAEAAELVVVLRLKDLLSGGLKAAGAAAKTAGGGLSNLSGHLSTMRKNIAGIITGPLGLIGLGAGLLTLGGIFKATVGKMNDLAFATEKVSGITRMSAEQASTLIAIFGKFGVSAERTGMVMGFLEKAIGNFTKSAKLSAKFTADFHYSLTTAAGKAKDANTVFLQLADIWTNKTVPQSQKAALAARLLGRGYADLVPVLNLGSKGIKEAADQAKAMGLVLTTQNVVQLKQYRDALREAGDAVGGLQLQLGLALVPTLVDMSKAATKFISQNRDKIIQFFKDGVKFAQDLAQTIQDDVLPVFGKIADAWAKVPPDLKKLLIGGFVLNKLSGGLVTDAAGGLFKGLTGAAGKLVGGVFSRGGSPATPLYVTQVGGLPGVGGPGGPLAAAAKGIGLAGIAAIAASVAVSAVVVAAAKTLANTINPSNTDRNGANATRNYRNPYASSGLIDPATGLYMNPADNRDQARRSPQISPYTGFNLGGNINAFTGFNMALTDNTQALLASAKAHREEFAARQRLFREARKLVGKGTYEAFLGSHTDKDALKVADSLAIKFAKSNAPFYRDSKNSARFLGDLRDLQRRFLNEGDTKSAAKIGRDIALMRGRQDVTTAAVNRVVTAVKSISFPGKNIDDKTLPRGGGKAPGGSRPPTGGGNSPGRAGGGGPTISVSASVSVRDSRVQGNYANAFGRVVPETGFPA